MQTGNFLGAVPKSWSVGAFRYYVQVREGQVDPQAANVEDLTLIAPNHVESGTGRLIAIETAAEQGAESGKYWCDAGDVIYSKIRPALRKVAMAPHDCLCSADMYPMKGRNGLSNRFLYWYLLSEQFSDFALRESARVAMPKLNRETLAAASVPVPSKDEQERIAHFLDEQTNRVDALISEKERLLGAVREYADAEISRLLTAGVSGAELLSTRRSVLPLAPAAWRVAPFKRALQGMSQGWSPQCESRPADEGEWGVLKVGCVNGTYFDATENKALPAELKPDQSCAIRRGDVLVSRANTRELVGMAALVNGDFPTLMLCDKLYRLDLRTDWVSPDYAVLALRSEASRRQIELGASGASSSMQNISQDVIRELVVAFPPIEEQHEIVLQSTRIRQRTTVLAEHVEGHIGRLREYRSSLISAAVTGQLDISTFDQREAA